MELTVTIPLERTRINLVRKFPQDDWFMRSRLGAVIIRLLSRIVPLENGSGMFGSNTEETKTPANAGGISLKDQYMFKHRHLNLGQGRPAGSWQHARPSESVKVVNPEPLEISPPMSREEVSASNHSGRVAQLPDDLDTPIPECRRGPCARHADSGAQAGQKAQEARRIKSRITPSAIVAVLFCVAVVVIIKKGRHNT
jgi:hypothetical protein